MGKKLCIITVGSFGRAEAIANAVQETFHAEVAPITYGLRGATDILGEESYDAVIIDGIANVRDAWAIALGVGTNQFRHFNGWAWRGTGRGTPIFMIVPPEEHLDVHGITNVSVLVEPVETAWLMARLGEFGFSRRVPTIESVVTVPTPAAAPTAASKEPISAF